MKKIPVFLFAVCTILMAGCSKEKEQLQPKSMYYSYFPLELGSWKVFSVDSQIYKGIADTPELHHWQLRELVAAPFTDAAGEQAYRVERYKRTSPDDPWQLYQSFIEKLTPGEAQTVENNQRLVKLSFPVESGRWWNANKYNTSDPDKFDTSIIRSVHEKYNNGVLQFDSTVTVRLQDYTDLITRLYWYEKYAAGKGLVYVKHDSLGTPKDKLQGWMAEYKLIEFGK